MNIHFEEIARIWPGIQNVFSVPHNQKQYNELAEPPDELIDTLKMLMKEHGLKQSDLC